jgi:hypothetical protein
MRKPFAALAATVAALAILAPSALAAPRGTVVLKFFDPHGNGALLTPSQARTVMHGAGGWDTDALLDPKTMQDVREYPLYASGSQLRFHIPGKAVAFAVSWPTGSEGYSYVIVDDGGAGFASGGTVIFNYLAARDAKRRLDEELAARPEYVESAAFKAAYRKARSNLSMAKEGRTDSERGKYGQRALDAVSRANQLLLTEYGPKYARDHETDPWVGLTVDDPSIYPKWAGLASAVTQPLGWVRIVFDPTIDGGNPAYYRSAVEAADAAGLKILGQPIDSSFANRYTRAQYLNRFKAYVNAYPQVDAWEVGNEVNGCWVDSLTNAKGECENRLVPPNDRIRNKIADAAAYVREKRPQAKVVLTLYWEIGGDAAKWSTFNWARANLPAAVRKDIDVVLLSQYVEDAPMGLAFDQVMNALHEEFPEQKIGLGELDYWSTDTSKVWWAFDRSSPRAGRCGGGKANRSALAARRRVASSYYAAAAGYPFSVLGGFWWYFPEEMPCDPKLQAAVRNVVKAITAR